jgi:hypothetical protein
MLKRKRLATPKVSLSRGILKRRIDAALVLALPARLLVPLSNAATAL